MNFQLKSNAMQRLFDAIGLGAASWDLIGTAQGEPLLGAKQPLGSWHETGGGPVATALVTLARLGRRVAIVGATGDDGYGAKIHADLRAEGVDTTHLQSLPGSSHVAFVLAEAGHDRRTIWWHNDRAVLDAFVPQPTMFAATRALLIDTHMPQAALQAAQWVRASGGVVMLDAERVKETTLELLPHCDYQVVSERFARQATGSDDPAEGARILHERYDQVAVVTCGERGSWLAAREEFFHTPAFQVDVVDTTGAGDVFHGAFLHGVLEGWSLRETARFAAAVAALKCRKLGGRAGIPSPGEVQALLSGAVSEL
jgi:ribokinase